MIFTQNHMLKKGLVCSNTHRVLEKVKQTVCYCTVHLVKIPASKVFYVSVKEQLHACKDNSGKVMDNDRLCV